MFCEADVAEIEGKPNVYWKMFVNIVQKKKARE